MRYQIKLEDRKGNMILSRRCFTFKSEAKQVAKTISRYFDPLEISVIEIQPTTIELKHSISIVVGIIKSEGGRVLKSKLRNLLAKARVPVKEIEYVLKAETEHWKVVKGKLGNSKFYILN